MSCSSNCAKCDSSTVCTECLTGYYLKDNTCHENCVFPCSECESNDGEACTQCYLGYTLNGNVCEEDLTCTSLEACSCPISAPFVTDSCQACTFSDQNCAKCDGDDLAVCSGCVGGYYFVDAACEKCPTGCDRCSSENYCKKCSDGFFMQYDKKEPLGICEACSSEEYCKTCEKSPNKCTSCVDGYTLRGKSCRSDKHINIKFVFNVVFS